METFGALQMAYHFEQVTAQVVIPRQELPASMPSTLRPRGSGTIARDAG